ncbi:hypothetical protein AALA98_10690 [Lachnospiraceae bacterium 45-W7]
MGGDDHIGRWYDRYPKNKKAGAEQDRRYVNGYVKRGVCAAKTPAGYGVEHYEETTGTYANIAQQIAGAYLFL